MAIEEILDLEQLEVNIYRGQNRDIGTGRVFGGQVLAQALVAARRTVDAGVESAAAVLAHGRQTWGFKRILAITSPDNEASIRLLAKLGFRFERMARLSEDAPEVKVFAVDA